MMAPSLPLPLSPLLPSMATANSFWNTKQTLFCIFHYSLRLHHTGKSLSLPPSAGEAPGTLCFRRIPFCGLLGYQGWRGTLVLPLLSPSKPKAFFFLFNHPQPTDCAVLFVSCECHTSLLVCIFIHCFTFHSPLFILLMSLIIPKLVLYC